MNIKIEKCKRGDEVVAGRIYDKVTKRLTETVNYPRWTYKVYPSTEYAAAMIARGCLYMAYSDGEAVAAFVLNDDPSGNYAKVGWGMEIAEGEYLVIHAFAIDTDHQRLGIGRRIVEFCIAIARENGYKAIRLDTVTDNYPAKALYERCGFKCFGDYDLDRNRGIPSFTMYEYLL